MLIPLPVFMDMLMVRSVTTGPGTVIPGAIHTVTLMDRETGVAIKIITGTGGTIEIPAAERRGGPAPPFFC